GAACNRSTRAAAAAGGRRLVAAGAATEQRAQDTESRNPGSRHVVGHQPWPPKQSPLIVRGFRGFRTASAPHATGPGRSAAAISRIYTSASRPPVPSRMISVSGAPRAPIHLPAESPEESGPSL